jgi:hypothetical protein
MTKFWIWGVRNPAVALAGLATLAGMTGAADWSISLTVVMVLGFIADTATRVARRSRKQQMRARAQIIELEAAARARRAVRERAA